MVFFFVFRCYIVCLFYFSGIWGEKSSKELSLVIYVEIGILVFLNRDVISFYYKGKY